MRPGQSVECELGAPLDDFGAGESRVIAGLPGPARYFATVVQAPTNALRAMATKVAVLGHPNVASLVGVGDQGGRGVVVQELPEGLPLGAWLGRYAEAGAAPPLEDVARVFRHVVTALRHAHQAQVTHGGLSPRCVAVAKDATGEFEVQVADFGLVPLLRAHATSAPPWTWSRLAPEQVEAPLAGSAATDLFALGVLLAEMLSTKATPGGYAYPWWELASTRPKEVRAALGSLRPDVPDALWDLAAGLLKARPQDRAPRTTMDLARALAQVSWEPRAVPVAAVTDASRERASAPSPSGSVPPRALLPVPERTSAPEATRATPKVVPVLDTSAPVARPTPPVAARAPEAVAAATTEEAAALATLPQSTRTTWNLREPHAAAAAPAETASSAVERAAPAPAVEDDPATLLLTPLRAAPRALPEDDPPTLLALKPLPRAEVAAAPRVSAGAWSSHSDAYQNAEPATVPLTAHRRAPVAPVAPAIAPSLAETAPMLGGPPPPGARSPGGAATERLPQRARRPGIAVLAALGVALCVALGALAWLVAR